MSEVKVHQSEMIHKDLLFEHPRNSNKQDKHMFKELRKSIREQGFDETLLVVPRDDGEEGYWLVAGNHRYRAGKAEGIKEFPCVVRSDWDETEQQIELVRRNYVRGAIDKDMFTMSVNALASEQGVSIADIQEAMGFKDDEQFLEYYKQENEKLEQQAHNAARTAVGTSASAIQMIDDLGLVLSKIFDEHGDTVPYSFIIFPAGAKEHLFVAATPSLVKSLTTVAEYCIANHLDINVLLGGLLTIGLDHSKLLDGGDREEVIEAGSEDIDQPGVIDSSNIKKNGKP